MLDDKEWREKQQSRLNKDLFIITIIILFVLPIICFLTTDYLLPHL